MSIALSLTGHVTLKLQSLGILRDWFQDPHGYQNLLQNGVVFAYNLCIPLSYALTYFYITYNA